MKNKLNEYEKLAGLICELTRCCSQKEEFFAASFNLSPTEVRLLMLFSFESTYSIKQLREQLSLTPGRITHIVDSLEKKKLVERFKDENDKRNYFVRTMPKANIFIQNMKDNYIQLHQNLLSNVNQEELSKIFSSMEILVDTFKQWTKDK